MLPSHTVLISVVETQHTLSIGVIVSIPTLYARHKGFSSCAKPLCVRYAIQSVSESNKYKL